MDLPERFQKLVALGIDKSANLPELNNLTDRGKFPLKPWTAAKTVGTIDLIRRHNITDEETFVEKFQQESKIRLEALTEQVFEHQLKYFGKYKFDLDTVFKYTYCCVVLNSLKGNSTENAFEIWAKSKNIKLKKVPHLLDEKFHTDRFALDEQGNICLFISIKPHSFSHDCIQYKDVFAGLQLLTELTRIPWVIYYQKEKEFCIINLNSFSVETQEKIKAWANKYAEDEITEITSVLQELSLPVNR